jgi:putative solute:sodium symporter small subunit
MARANGDGGDLKDEPGLKPAAAPAPAAAAPNVDAYWRANLRLMAILLAIWALASFGFGIWLREPLDAFSVAGAPLGFWFAQQGSIYVFVVLIFVYVLAMGRLDRRHDVDGLSAAREEK